MTMLSKFSAGIFIIEIVIIVLFGLFTVYDDTASPRHPEVDNATNTSHHEENPTVFLDHYYPMFQDIHVMIFIGFGFLFTFLKRYSYSAVGVNMLLSAVLIQWAILCEGFFAQENCMIKISIEKLLTADVAAASGLIAWGALLGKTSPVQLLIMALIQMPLFACNEWLILEIYEAIDPGASMICHVFGAYFGLAASAVMYVKDHHGHPKESAAYHSDVFAMIGTIFLWLFWPSFNAALTTGDDRHRAVINTYLSLASCCVMTFAISSLISKRSRFNMVHIQNATLAGGVAMGAACSTMLQPYVALIIGCAAAVICTFGFKYLTPILVYRLHIHDTCGVNNLHGMMGILGGIIGAVMAAVANENMYGFGLYVMYPAMAPPASFSNFTDLNAQLNSIQPGSNRSASMQAAYQMIALATTLGISIVGGLIAGFVMRSSLLDPPNRNQLYDDTDYWEVPEEEEGQGSPVSDVPNHQSLGPNHVMTMAIDDGKSECH